MLDRSQQLAALSASFEQAPYGISIAEVHEGPRFFGVYVNPYSVQVLGLPTQAGLGIYIDEVVPLHLHEQVFGRYKECLNKKISVRFEDHYALEQGEVWLQVTMTPVLDSTGQVTMILTTTFDITEQVRAAQAERAHQEAIIQLQAAIVAELSTPLLTISEGVVVMPIIGAVDSGRTQQIMETLLNGISEHQARLAIVDITGVSVVDTAVANALIQAAQAVRLLGAEVVLTGIRPEVAQALVSLGTNLEGVVTRSTLQMGIAYSLHRV
jgi:rsbT co-antagonist protein RsbR